MEVVGDRRRPESGMFGHAGLVEKSRWGEFLAGQEVAVGRHRDSL
jgi:hypothetical protein